MGKTCTGCGATKDEGEFHWKNKAKGQRHPRCKECASSYSKAHYERNPDMYLAKSKRWKNKIRDENYERLLAYFADHPCVDCGTDNPLVLTFDHVDGTKDFDVCKALLGMKWESVVPEMEKCVVRCANCHMIKTSTEAGWVRARLFTTTP